MLAISGLVAMGCGGTAASSSGDGAQTPQTTVRAAVRSAVAQHDYRAACGYGTPRGRRRLVYWYNVSYGPKSDTPAGVHFRTCAQVVRFELQHISAFERRRLRRSLTFGKSSVSGNRATVLVTDHPGPQADWRHVELRKVNGRWRIEDSDVIPRGS
jgi:hypothetical protein